MRAANGRQIIVGPLCGPLVFKGFRALAYGQTIRQRPKKPRLQKHPG